MNKIIPFMLLPLVSSMAYANNYPDEFADFFHETPQRVSMVFSGEQQGLDLDAIVNYESLRIDPNNQTNLAHLKAFLSGNGLTDVAMSAILMDLKNGVSTDPSCQLRLDQCALSPEVGEVQYVYDFDNALLKIFVASDLLDADTEDEYASGFQSRHNAITNWSSLYGYSDFSGNNYALWDNYTTIGLPLGFITMDSQLDSQGKDNEIYALTYDIEYEHYRAQLGRHRYNPEFNSTDYLNNGARLSGDSLFIGTSRNLLKGGEAQAQKVFFYAPQSGQLEVYREGRLIMSQVVAQGRQEISYSDLPTGAYDIRLVLKVSGKEVVAETRQIVNNPHFSLRKGEFDILIGAGKLDTLPEHLEYTQREVNAYQDAYLQGLMNYRVSEGFMVGAGVTSNRQNTYAQLGGRYYWGSYASLDVVAGAFDSNEMFQTAQLTFAPFFIDYRHFEQNEQYDTYTLANRLYGLNGYEDIGIGLNGPLLGGQGYLRYNIYHNDDIDTHYANADDEYQTKMLSGSWSREAFGGQLSLNLDFNETYKEWNVGVNWSVAIGDNVDAMLTADMDEEGFSQNANYLMASASNENWSASGSAGVIITHENQVGSEFSATVSGQTEQFNASGYGFVNDDGTQTMTFNLSGTQILSSEGLFLTHERGRSFAVIEKHQPDSELKLNVTANGQASAHQTLSDDETVVRLNEYQDTFIHVDADGQNFDVSNNIEQGFVTPGSLYALEVDLAPLSSLLFVLDDIDGQPIQNLQCVGQGCSSVEPVTEDGVFRLNYRQGQPFQLVSQKGLCVYEPLASSSGIVSGYCLPGLEAQVQSEQPWESTAHLLTHQSEEVLIYLGQFNVDAFSPVQERLSALGLTVKKVRNGEEVYVYLEPQTSYTSEQMHYLNELDAYVLLKDSEVDLLTIQQQLGDYDDA